jgi:hypothetical protein
MIIKITNLIVALVLLCLPAFAQESNQLLGWDLTYSSILESNKVGCNEWIRKWLASDYQSPAKKWVSERQGEPIVSSVLIEYPAFHAGEHTTMWLFRTKDKAYFWQDIEKLKFSDIKKELRLQIYDDLLSQVSFWQQAKPVKPKTPESIPGYIGFLSLYDKDKSRQILLTQQDFIGCATEACKAPKLGRLMLALKPIILEND